MNILLKFKLYPSKLLLVKGVFSLFCAYLLVVFFSFNNIIKILKFITPKTPNLRYTLSAVYDVSEVLKYRFKLQQKCLLLAIATFILGVKYQKLTLFIGVKEEKGEFLAHSWIADESHQQFINNNDDFNIVYST